MRVWIIDEKLDKTKLVQKLVKVKRKTGLEFYRKQWVKPEYNALGSLDRNTVETLIADMKRRIEPYKKKMLAKASKPVQQSIEREIETRAMMDKVIKPIGKLIADEMQQHIKKYGTSQEELDKELKTLSDEHEKVRRSFYYRHEISEDEYKEHCAKFNKEFNELQKKRDEIRDSTIKLMKDALSSLRETGASKSQINAHFGKSKSKIRGAMEDALNCYPTDWIEASAGRGEIKIRATKTRGYFREKSQFRRNSTDEIYISGYSDMSQFETSVHELAHRMECSGNEELSKYERMFFYDRTGQEPAVPLQKLFPRHGYSANEYTRPDKFIHAYMGKIYNDGHYEISSMGIAYALTNPETLLKDKDMASFIFGTLAVLKLNK